MPFNPNITLEELRQVHVDFVSQRDWHKYHTPRNLTLALVGEVGELAEIFQWKSDEMCENLEQNFSEKEKENLRDELSDCLLYILRLSDVCGVDLPTAALDKMKKNELKYPVGRSLGRADKYTTYMDQQQHDHALKD
ncbi:hypothetical protein C9374_011007 [Naegleria lovaniensis]|uniref:dCTP pyrophosphatase 1 n=1 Tax=Naegleria lovaniensis TaxID=51637 RepID=A0AA88GEV2_NAELO|nr:uncharacterized protein C9374_011007 [Naegleria lovaniensis]KAG2374170.1 hypothetical protein C9374_011007 [Naegleria lovaniensis]